MDYFFNIGLYHFLTTALILFAIGFLGTIISKNLLRILISLEIMFCGITLNIAAFSVYCDVSHFKGSILALFVIILLAIHVIIASAIILNIYKFKGSIDIENCGELKE
ncbi:NADH-quinone oxidoreductase subunit NuoK [bacterium]|nr:NADH-quinone oxidoreductase subunit NuoK [bacterium]